MRLHSQNLSKSTVVPGQWSDGDMSASAGRRRRLMQSVATLLLNHMMAGLTASLMKQ
jgi:hypothetical protein